MPEKQLRLRRPHSEILDAHIRNAAALAAMRKEGGLSARAMPRQEVPVRDEVPFKPTWKPMGGSTREELEAYSRDQEALRKLRKKLKRN